MATRVERTGIEACISKVNTAIDELNQAAADMKSQSELAIANLKDDMICDS